MIKRIRKYRRKRILRDDDGGDFTIGYFLNRKSAEMDIEREYKKFINADVFVGCFPATETKKRKRGWVNVYTC